MRQCQLLKLFLRDYMYHPLMLYLRSIYNNLKLGALRVITKTKVQEFTILDFLAIINMTICSETRVDMHLMLQT